MPLLLWMGGCVECVVVLWSAMAGGFYFNVDWQITAISRGLGIRLFWNSYKQINCALRQYSYSRGAVRAALAIAMPLSKCPCNKLCFINSGNSCIFPQTPELKIFDSFRRRNETEINHPIVLDMIHHILGFRSECLAFHCLDCDWLSDQLVGSNTFALEVQSARPDCHFPSSHPPIPATPLSKRCQQRQIQIRIHLRLQTQIHGFRNECRNWNRNATKNETEAFNWELKSWDTLGYYTEKAKNV